MTLDSAATTVLHPHRAGRSAPAASAMGRLHRPAGALTAAASPVPDRRAPVDDVPASNRVLNAWYGEFRTFPADRALADRIAETAPALPAAALAAHRFRRAALAAAFAAGIAQLLDLGAGIPTGSGDVLPATVNGRTVTAAYIDHDPIAVAALRALAGGRPQVVADIGDVTAAGPLLDRLTEQGLFDPTYPALVVLSLVLHHLADFQALRVLEILHRRLAPGSRLVLSAFIADPFTADVRDALTDRYPAPPLVLRTTAQTRALLRAANWPTSEPTGPTGLYTAVLHRQPSPGKAAP